MAKRLTLPEGLLSSADYGRDEVDGFAKWRCLLRSLSDIGALGMHDDIPRIERLLAVAPSFEALTDRHHSLSTRGRVVRRHVLGALEEAARAMPSGLSRRGSAPYEFLLCWHLHLNQGMSVSAVGLVVGDPANGHLSYEWTAPEKTVRERMWRDFSDPPNPKAVTLAAWPGVRWFVGTLERRLQVELGTAAIGASAATPPTTGPGADQADTLQTTGRAPSSSAASGETDHVPSEDEPPLKSIDHVERARRNAALLFPFCDAFERALVDHVLGRHDQERYLDTTIEALWRLGAFVARAQRHPPDKDFLFNHSDTQVSGVGWVSVSLPFVPSEPNDPIPVENYACGLVLPALSRRDFSWLSSSRERLSREEIEVFGSDVVDTSRGRQVLSHWRRWLEGCNCSLNLEQHAQQMKSERRTERQGARPSRSRAKCTMPSSSNGGIRGLCVFFAVLVRT